MSERKGAYASTASDTNFRRKWDKEEYAEKARQRDAEEKERMQENEERLKTGKKPRKGAKKDVPTPTELMKLRDYDLELEKNLNKTIVVANPSGRGPGQPGFFCEKCNRTYRDTAAYLDHINSRAHLRMLGQKTQIERSTVEQVRERIAFLREQRREASKAKEFDFNKRLAEVKAKADAERAAKKAQKKAEKEKARMELLKDVTVQQDDDMAQMMGFAGFGSSKK
ncbi:SNU23 [Sanghuangporus sanghuang]